MKASGRRQTVKGERHLETKAAQDECSSKSVDPFRVSKWEKNIRQSGMALAQL